MAWTLRQLALRDLPAAEVMLADGKARLECLKRRITECDRKGLDVPNIKRTLQIMTETYDLQLGYIEILHKEIANDA